MLDPIRFVDIVEQIEHRHGPYRSNYVHCSTVERDRHFYSTCDWPYRNGPKRRGMTTEEGEKRTSNLIENRHRQIGTCQSIVIGVTIMQMFTVIQSHRGIKKDEITEIEQSFRLIVQGENEGDHLYCARFQKAVLFK